MSPRQAILRKTNWALAVAALLLPALPAGAATLKQIATVDLPGPPGKRFDYLTIDYDKNYLLSAHLAAGLLYVIDLKTNRLVKAIPGVPGCPRCGGRGVRTRPEQGVYVRLGG